jgi:dTDP-4-dehydrorhamnose reductase
MKILLLGGLGQVGWELRRALAPLGDVTVLTREVHNGLSGNLENPEALRHAVRQLVPDVIANAAAYTQVDRAETEPERAERVNAEAPGVLAVEAARLGACLVQYSTDYVFDGSGTAPRDEDDAPAPLGVYGATKWRGEQAVRAAGCRHLILRTQWIYAARGENFLRKMLRLAAERDRLEVVDDQTGAPTGADLVADVTAHVLRGAAARPELFGTYHLAARGETTWHGYARYVIGEARRIGRPVRVSDEEIKPVSTEALQSAARRPRNSRLDVARLESAFGVRLPDWRAGVARALAESVCPQASGAERHET